MSKLALAKSKIETISGAVMSIASMISIGRKVWEYVEEHRPPKKKIELLFKESDYAYSWLQSWLATHPDKDKTDCFIVITGDANELENGTGISNAPEADEEDAVAVRHKVLMVPAKTFTFEYKGVSCMLSRPDKAVKTSDDGDDRSYMMSDLVLTFETDNFDICVDFMTMIQTKAIESSKHCSKVYMFERYWQFAKHCPPSRSVILPEGLMDGLLNDMSKFRASYDWYAMTGVPYRRGYLLYGIPGSGKTSTVLCLANALGCDIYWLSLQGKSDSDIMCALHGVPAGSIVLIEDIDCAFSERENEDASDKLTFSGLLNAIDGVAAKEGSVIVMTTNHRENLDPALIRPGRVDKMIEFGHATQLQIQELALRFLGNERAKEAKALAKQWVSESISMAEVQNRLIGIINENGSEI